MDRQTNRSFSAPFSVAFPGHRVSRPSHLGLGGTVEDRVLMHSPQVLHDSIWTQNPAHLEQDTVSGLLRARGALVRPPTAATCQVAALTFQPVALKLLPALPMVRVRSHMPGRLAARGQEEQMLKWAR